MNEQTQDTPVKRNYKDLMFTLIFHNKKKLLRLYNAISGKNYKNPELLTITTLENAIYMSVKNDLSFIIDSRLSLYEHQSSHNPNMALRFLFYLADLYSKLTKDDNIYGSKKIMIPPPRFIVFYNGRDPRPDYEVIKLSDLYILKEEKVSLELTVDVLNINKGHNKELMNACKDLSDYAEYVYRVRKYAEVMTIEAAVDKAIDECIREGILRDFLKKHKAEARAMSIYEYNEEEHMRMEREDAFKDGHEAGREAGIAEGHKAGLAEGHSDILELIVKMSADGLGHMVVRLGEEPEFYEEMVKKYLK